MSGELILVVDDSREIVKHLTEYLLPTMGYQTLAAYNGREGLRLIREKNPDLVMLDLNLPEMTGLDVLQAMAQDSLEIPVVLMTGYGSEKSAIEAFRLGIKDYLVKPFTIEEVGDTVERALLEARLRHDRQRLLVRLNRVEAEMRRQVKEMRTLFRIGKSVTSQLSIQQVLDYALDGVLNLTGAERAAIWLPDASRTTLTPYMREAYETDLEMGPLPVTGTLVGELFAGGQTLRQASFSGVKEKIDDYFAARALLCVPLSMHSRVRGLLCASNHDAPRAFSERDELLLTALSDYVTIAIENAGNYETAEAALADKMEELKTLLGITRTITSSLNLDEVAQLTIREVHASWDIAASSIWLLDGTRGHLRVLANVGTELELLSQFELEVGQGIVGHVVETEQPLYTNDAAAHPRHYRLVDRRTGYKTESILCVPLRFRDRVIGALQLLNKQDGPFDEDDVTRASSIATAVAIAVSNARLFEEAASREQLLAATLEHNGNPVVIIDQDGCLLLLNQRARQLFNLSEGVIGASAAESLPASLSKLLSPVLKEEIGIQRREIELDPGMFWLCTLAPIPGYGWILVLQDITYLKEMDTAKSNFVATVSHDLRAPLNSIIGFASAVGQVGPLSDQQTEFVGRITDAAQRMTNLVAALLDLARVDSRLEQVREVCDLPSIVRHVLTDLQGQAMTQEVDLSLTLAAESAAIYGDPTQIHQAISNLVDNAIKYSQAGQEVRVSVNVHEQNVMIRVSDAGPGIPAKDIPHIFDKFYRVRGENARGGAGLGLTLVRSVAEAHGGWVWVESEQPHGSTFTLQLPLHQESETEIVRTC